MIPHSINKEQQGEKGVAISKQTPLFYMKT